MPVGSGFAAGYEWTQVDQVAGRRPAGVDFDVTTAAEWREQRAAVTGV